MTPDQLIDTVEQLTRAISGDSAARVLSLPVAGTELTLILEAPNGIGRLLGKGGDTFRALRRVVSAAAWRTGFSFRLVINDPRERRSVTNHVESQQFPGKFTSSKTLFRSGPSG